MQSKVQVCQNVKTEAELCKSSSMFDDFPQNFAEPDPEQEFKGSDKIDTKITTFSGTLKKLLKLVLSFERD